MAARVQQLAALARNPARERMPSELVGSKRCPSHATYAVVLGTAPSSQGGLHRRGQEARRPVDGRRHSPPGRDRFWCAILNGLVEPLVTTLFLIEVLAFMALQRHALAQRERTAKQQSLNPVNCRQSFPLQ